MLTQLIFGCLCSEKAGQCEDMAGSPETVWYELSTLEAAQGAPRDPRRNPAGLSSCSGGLRPLVDLCVEPAGSLRTMHGGGSAPSCCALR